MKSLALIILLLLPAMYSSAQSQMEMKDQANKSFLKADKELNETYARVLSEYKTDTAFIKAFKAAQRIWIQFRDAEMKAKYPDRPAGYEGSAAPMCWSTYKEGLTRERIKTLRVWIDGIEEGDLCSGSVKAK